MATQQQFGIEVRLLPGKAGGQGAAANTSTSEPLTFHDPQSAALYILMSYDIPLLEFVTWTLQERSLIINKPTAFSSNTWKFFLLQDQSVTQLKEQIETAAAAAAAAAVSSTKQHPRPSIFPSPPGLLTIEAGQGCRNDMSSPSPILKEENNNTTPPTASSSVDDLLVCRTRASAKRYTLSCGPPSSGGGAAAQHQKSVSRCAIKRQPTTTATTTTPPGGGVVGARKRGSNRRIPEKENVTECPECGRKGQSIFDPSISDREGHVWQYFYCRNSMCAKGRSCNRYIGWAIRPLDR